MVPEGRNTTLIGTIADPGRTETQTLTIAWGDGTESTVILEPGAGGGRFRVPHAYANNPTGEPSGVYTVTVAVSDQDGATDQATTTVTVENAAPRLELRTLSATEIAEGGSVTLTGNVTDWGLDDSQLVSVDWGDGTQSMATLTEVDGILAFSAEHGYANEPPGPACTYTIVSTVTDNDGGSRAFINRVRANNVAPVVTDLTSNAAGPAVVALGEPVTITGTFTDPGSADTHQIRINWGDGTAVQLVTLLVGARDFMAEHVFATQGDYTISVQALDGGKIASPAVTTPVTITPALPAPPPTLTASGVIMSASGSLTAMRPAGDAQTGLRGTSAPPGSGERLESSRLSPSVTLVPTRIPAAVPDASPIPVVRRTASPVVLWFDDETGDLLSPDTRNLPGAFAFDPSEPPDNAFGMAWGTPALPEEDEWSGDMAAG